MVQKPKAGILVETGTLTMMKGEQTYGVICNLKGEQTYGLICNLKGEQTYGLICEKGDSITS